MKAIFLCGSEQNIKYVYGPEQLAQLRELTGISDRVWSLEEAEQNEELRDTEFIFSTWGMARPDAEQISRIFPKLKAVFYAAGSVQAFAAPFIERGIAVFSAWQANALPVAEYTLAQILLSAKGYFQVQAQCRSSRAAAAELEKKYPGMYDIAIGLLGLGAVGGAVAQLLKGFKCRVLAYDPFASDEKLRALGVERADMDRIFAECDIISNHLANLPATQGIIRRDHIMSMKDYATFINTGRGPQLSEIDLADKLRMSPGVTALLDVLCDEINSDTNPLNALPNCFITPHIAGSAGSEVHRMAQYMIDEYQRYTSGGKVRWQVSAEMLRTMA